METEDVCKVCGAILWEPHERLCATVKEQERKIASLSKEVGRVFDILIRHGLDKGV